MAYRWVDHTAELELRLDASTEAEVFADALAAIHELLGDGPGGEETLYELEIAAADRATLLATWLEELLFRAETEDLVPQHVERLALASEQLHATVRAQRGAPPHLIKGVTYHRLSFEPLEGRYRATVVLDV